MEREDMGPVTARLDRRRRTHDAVSARLAALDDDQLAALLAETGSWRDHAHGGQSGVIEVEGAKVFVKKIALTDLERTAGNEGSTANLFELPVFYQYGVGSAGFGAWRELSAYLRAGAWVLADACPYFPLVYHWRVLPRTVAPSAEQRARLDWLVNYWGGSDAVRARLEAILAASASIVLFLEHVPEMLETWLRRGLSGERAPDAVFEAAILRAHQQLREAAAFMNERGMLHFDLHAWNVLTDGEQLYAADFGLALCADFELSPAERAFFETHRLYDRAYVDWALVEWLAPQADPPRLTPALTALVERCAPVAKIMGTFIGALRESKTAPYPAAALEAALR
jgi:hypothetical protein